MEYEEPADTLPLSRIPLGQVAIICFLACLLFLSGMGVMYLWIAPVNNVPSYYPPGLLNALSARLWYEVFIPLWRGFGDVFSEHAYCFIAIFLLAGDRILNGAVGLYELIADYRRYILVFLGGAVFVILGSYMMSGYARYAQQTPCPHGQMLTAGGSCIWVNRY